MKAKFLLCRSAIAKMLAAAIVIIVVVGIAGAAYYQALPILRGKGPEPTPPPIAEVEVVSLEGFSYTDMGYTDPEKIPVLHQGASANITLNVYLHYNESRDVSLSLDYSWGEGSEGVDYRFYPSTLELPPEGMATSTLTLEADSDASSNLYYPTLGIQVEGFPGGYGQPLGYILVFPTTPSYIFSVYAEESPTPTQPPPTNETTPPPIPTPWTPPPWEPEIQIKRGGEAHVIFYILTMIETPSLKLSLNYQSGELPEEINANITHNPLKAGQNSLTVRSLLLTLTASSQTPEETYEITANGSVDSITFERKFHLKVTM